MVFSRLAALLSTQDIQDFCSGVPGSSEERRRLQEQDENSALKTVLEFGPFLMSWYLRMPAMFLNTTLVGYLIGLGLYWLFIWREAARSKDFSGNAGSRNVSFSLVTRYHITIEADCSPGTYFFLSVRLFLL